MLPLWTINDFNSFVKQTHFNTLREKYQIPVNIPIHLPLKHEKCYYKGVKDVGVYEQHLKAGLPLKCSPPSSATVPWAGRHPNLSEPLESFSGRGSPVRGYDR